MHTEDNARLNAEVVLVFVVSTMQRQEDQTLKSGSAESQFSSGGPEAFSLSVNLY